MQQVTDDILLARYKTERSEEAFQALVERYAPMVFATCLRILRSVELAEDASQGTFYLLAKKANGLAGERSLAPWLYATARMVSLSLRKKELRRMRYERPFDDSLTSSQDSGQLTLMLDQALSRLRPKERRVLVLRFLQGLSLSEVGEVTGDTEDATRMQVQRALNQLRRQFATFGLDVSASVILEVLSRPSEALPASLIPAAAKLGSYGAPVSPHLLTLVKGATLIPSSTKFAIGAASLAILFCGGFACAKNAGAFASSPPVSAASADFESKPFISHESAVLKTFRVTFPYASGNGPTYVITYNEAERAGILTHDSHGGNILTNKPDVLGQIVKGKIPVTGTAR